MLLVDNECHSEMKRRKTLADSPYKVIAMALLNDVLGNTEVTHRNDNPQLLIFLTKGVSHILARGDQGVYSNKVWVSYPRIGAYQRGRIIATACEYLSIGDADSTTNRYHTPHHITSHHTTSHHATLHYTTLNYTQYH